MQAIDIFIAYAEQDKDLMERLRKQLSAAERIGLVDAWHDGEIEIGTDREEAARKAMEEAEIIVLLLSADFFASEYLYEKEMGRALQLSKSGKATVLPVLLKECTWQLTPLANLQILPKNGAAVTSDHWKHPDRAFKNVVDELIRVSNSIRKKAGAPTTKYDPSSQKEQQEDVAVEKDKKDQTPLWKLGLYAFAGLAALALLSSLVNTLFMNPKPKEPEPIGQEQPLEMPEETPDKPPVFVPGNSKAPFPTIKLNGLLWSAENLKTPFENSWCYADNTNNCEYKGRLYNYETALQLCPEGWRLPTKEEWLTVTVNDLQKLKLLKGGVYDRESSRQLDSKGYYWTSERSHGGEAWAIEYRGDKQALDDESRYIHWGMSCRCVKK